MCSACAGDYENPEVTAPECCPKEDDQVLDDSGPQVLIQESDTMGESHQQNQGMTPARAAEANGQREARMTTPSGAGSAVPGCYLPSKGRSKLPVGQGAALVPRGELLAASERLRLAVERMQRIDAFERALLGEAVRAARHAANTLQALAPVCQPEDRAEAERLDDADAAATDR